MPRIESEGILAGKRHSSKSHYIHTGRSQNGGWHSNSILSQFLQPMAARVPAETS